MLSDDYLKNPEFIRLLNSENQLKARHLENSVSTVEINQSWISITRHLLERGEQEGNVRHNTELGFFYLINHAIAATYLL